MSAFRDKPGTVEIIPPGSKPDPNRGFSKRDLHRRAEAASKYCCVYVIGPKSGWPIKVGISNSPRDIWNTAQQWYWEEYVLHALCWTDGRPLAERVKARIDEILTEHNQWMKGSWYNMEATFAQVLIEGAARDLGITLFDEPERQRKLQDAITAAMKRIAR